MATKNTKKTKSKSSRSLPASPETPSSSQTIDGRRLRGLPETLRTQVADLEKPLAEKFLEFHALLMGQELSRIEHHHRLGTVIAEITDVAVYGEGAVEKFATLIGRDPATLYKWAKVSGCWSLKEATQIASRIGARIQGVTWSHLERVAEATWDRKSKRFDLPARDNWIEVVLSEGLTYDALCTRINGAPPNSGNTDAPEGACETTSSPGPQNQRAKVVKAEVFRMSSYASSISKNLEQWNAQVFDVIDRGGVPDDGTLLNGLEQAQNSYAALQQDVDMVLEKLSKAIVALKEMPHHPNVPANSRDATTIADALTGATT